MSKDYYIEKLPNGWYAFFHHADPRFPIFRINDEELVAFHILSGHILGCSDENCPCHEAGRVAGRDAEREPFLRQL